MSDYAFGLKTPRDFLDKARREIRRLESAMAEGSLASELDIQDLAINAALTLWHVADWIAKYPDDRHRAAIDQIKHERGWQKSNPQDVIYDYVLIDSHMALCAALANGVKHFELYSAPRFDSTRILNPSSQVYAGAAPVDLETTMSAMPSVRAANPLQMMFPKLKINDVGLPAMVAFRAALDYWDRFFTKYHL